MAKTAKRSSARGGSSSKPSGFVAWMLWLIVIGLLSMIARYAYIAAQPDKGCYTLIGRSPSCEMTARNKAAPSQTHPKPTGKGYSAKDRAKLDHIIDDAILEKR